MSLMNPHIDERNDTINNKCNCRESLGFNSIQNISSIYKSILVKKQILEFHDLKGHAHFLTMFSH